MRLSTALVYAGVLVESVIAIEDPVCSSGVYGDVVPVLATYGPAQSFCSSRNLPSSATVTTIMTSATASTMTSAMARIKRRGAREKMARHNRLHRARTPEEEPENSDSDGQGSEIWSSVSSVAGSILDQVCSCIEPSTSVTTTMMTSESNVMTSLTSSNDIGPIPGPDATSSSISSSGGRSMSSSDRDSSTAVPITTSSSGTSHKTSHSSSSRSVFVTSTSRTSTSASRTSNSRTSTSSFSMSSMSGGGGSTCVPTPAAVQPGQCPSVFMAQAISPCATCQCRYGYACGGRFAADASNPALSVILTNSVDMCVENCDNQRCGAWEYSPGKGVCLLYARIGTLLDDVESFYGDRDSAAPCLNPLCQPGGPLYASP